MPENIESSRFCSFSQEVQNSMCHCCIRLNVIYVTTVHDIAIYAPSQHHLANIVRILLQAGLHVAG